MINNTDELYELIEHSGRVGELAREISYRMGLDENLCKKAFIAGAFHDLGKLFVSDEVISKPDIVNQSEFDVIKQHVKFGVDILSMYLHDVDIIHAIEDHHENIDGSGYPYSKSGNEISVLGRILGVADRFDALTSDRVYRKAYSYEKALNILECEKYKLDERVFDALLQFISKRECKTISYVMKEVIN